MTQRLGTETGRVHVHPARPTIYNGIPMRSRLEADFARWLDSPDTLFKDATWEYEPQCFANKDGQYLPDFKLTTTDGAIAYVEVKPDSLTDEQKDTAAARMRIVWSSEPHAELLLAVWIFGEPRPRSIRCLSRGPFQETVAMAYLRPDVESICTALADWIGQPAVGTDSASWRNDAVLMLDVDHRYEAEIRELLWRGFRYGYFDGQLRSMADLRENYDQLKTDLGDG